MSLAPSISPESQTPFRVLYFWNNTKVLSPYVWLYCCTIVHFHILISHILKQHQVRFKFLLSDETSHRNSFWAYSASITDYVPHINLLSSDNFVTQFIHLWNFDKDFNQMSEGWPSIVLNTPAYDTSAILWRKRATQQLEISAYHYMTPVCLQVHARHIETATHHCSRPKTMLPSKTYFMLLYHKIQEKWIFY